MVGGLFGPVGGALSAAAMISAGNKIIKENSVEDPASQIGQEILQALARK
jgi:hypothetical protein